MVAVAVSELGNSLNSNMARADTSAGALGGAGNEAPPDSEHTSHAAFLVQSCAACSRTCSPSRCQK